MSKPNLHPIESTAIRERRLHSAHLMLLDAMVTSMAMIHPRPDLLRLDFEGISKDIISRLHELGMTDAEIQKVEQRKAEMSAKIGAHSTRLVR